MTPLRKHTVRIFTGTGIAMVTMRWTLALFLALNIASRVEAQVQAGFVASATSGSTIKLHGLVVFPMSGGYIVISVPPKDLVRLARLAEMLSPHMVGLEMLEHIEKDARRLSAVRRPASEVPLGTIYLKTSDVFPHHKFLDRYVQQVGTFMYINRRGLPITVGAYAGGPRR